MAASDSIEVAGRSSNDTTSVPGGFTDIGLNLQIAGAWCIIQLLGLAFIYISPGGLEDSTMKRLLVSCGFLFGALLSVTGCSSDSARVPAVRNATSASADEIRRSSVQSMQTSPQICIAGAPNCGRPDPTPQPTTAPVLRLQPMSQDANIAARYPTSVGNGALLEVSQGATVQIDWECADGYLNPCPYNVVSFWTGTASNGLSVSFSPQSTRGGALATEFFTASTTANPGLYGASSCLASPQNFVSAPICKTFLINVVSSDLPSIPAPSAVPGMAVKLQISKAGTNNIMIPGQGHLYVELYVNGVATTQLQAGPLPAGGVLLLAAEKFQQFPYTQPSEDISSFVFQSTLITNYNNYLANQKANLEPSYNVAGTNSNTWADGLLLSAGMPQSAIDNAVSKLSAKAGLTLTGYSYGSSVEQCFLSTNGRIVFVQPGAPIAGQVGSGPGAHTLAYGDCANAPHI